MAAPQGKRSGLLQPIHLQILFIFEVTSVVGVLQIQILFHTLSFTICILSWVVAYTWEQ